MKRQNYRILLDGKHVATKHAWNAALREMRQIIRDALPVGVDANPISSETEDLDKWTWKSGTFVWARSDGKEHVVRFELETPNPTDR